MTDNPFIAYNEAHDSNDPTIPKFDRPIKLSIRLSREAYERLKILTGEANSKQVSYLLEQIGLYALDVCPPSFEVDSESDTSTEDCRQSGFEDGYNGDPSFALRLYGNAIGAFQNAYLRGYYEGNYIRNKK
jgi:hypothetical protein